MKAIKTVWILFIAFAALTTFSNTGFTEELVVTEDGKVGIGITTPFSKLQVIGANNPIPIRIGQNSGGNDFTMDIAAGQGLASLVAGATINSAGSGYEFLGARGASRLLLHDGTIKFYTSNTTTGTAGGAVDGLTSGQEKMTILSSGNVGIGTTNPQAALDVKGKIHAGNSDIYFTKTNHNHTGFGNTAGYAAIENAANYGALMILGRAGTSKGRYVRLWDYLQVNGGMDITGNVGIGTTTPQSKLHVVGTVKADTVSASTVNLTTVNATTVKTNDLILPNGIWKSDGRVGIGTTNPAATANFTLPPPAGGITSPVKVHIVGNVYIDGLLETTGRLLSSNNSSDARLKESVQTVVGSLAKIGQIRGVSFDWIDKSRGEGRQLGVIAQEVEAVFPELVMTDSQGYKSVVYDGLVAPLIEAVKELKAEVEFLQSENDQLAGENHDLKEINQSFEQRLSKLEQMVSRD